MRVTYNKWVATIMLILGLINLVLGVWLALLGRFNPSLFIGVVVFVIGVLYWQRPYFIVESSGVVVPAMLGPVRRSFPFKTPQDIRIENNRLLVRDETYWRRVPVRRWLSDRRDWAALEHYLAGIS
jgi:hypothetical protein